MKGLHNIRLPQATSTWRWYSAIQSRRGRRHLIKVPVVAVDLTAFLVPEMRRRLPYHLRYSDLATQEQWAREMTETNFNLVIPNAIKLDVEEPQAMRLCTMEQEARRYELASQPMGFTPTRPRGYCDRCWRVWPHHQQFIAETRHATALGYLITDKEQWATNVRRDFRPPR